MNRETPVENTGFCASVHTCSRRADTGSSTHRSIASDLFSAGLLHLFYQQLDPGIKSGVYLGLKWLLGKCH